MSLTPFTQTAVIRVESGFNPDSVQTMSVTRNFKMAFGRIFFFLLPLRSLKERRQARGRRVEILQRYISKGRARILDLALAMARRLPQGLRVEWLLWICQKCAEIFALSCQTCATLRSLSVISLYASTRLSIYCGIGFSLYELCSCLWLAVLHQISVKHLVDGCHL